MSAPIKIADIVLQAEHASNMVEQLRSRMLDTSNSTKQNPLIPKIYKSSPMFNRSQLAFLCGITSSQLTHRLTKMDGLPIGTTNANHSRRTFSLLESRQWVKSYRSEYLKPEGARAATITIGNFKGGASKTTTAMVLAQGLSLLGHKVLVIDTDPQGSLTTLFGIIPDAEVEWGQTIMPTISGDEISIRSAIQKTYWDGIDLVASAPLVYAAEFMLPSMQIKNPNFKFWDVINMGLEDVRDEYDIIILDTPPSLSFTTINAFMAADGLIIPIPPNALDYASSAQFWSLFSDLSSNLVEKAGLEKSFDFIHILLSRVDLTDVASSIVRTWISDTYKEKVLPIEIPKTAVTSNCSAEFATIYDVQKYEGNSKTFKRAKDAYDRLCELIETAVRTVWIRQIEEQ